MYVDVIVDSKAVIIDRVIGVSVDSREVLVQEIERRLEETLKAGYIPGPRAAFLSISMPCGHVAVYEFKEVIPDVDVQCSCGDPKHWLIKYKEVYLHGL